MQRNDRSYKDLKQKQKSAIADKTYKMHLKFYLENQRMPDATEMNDICKSLFTAVQSLAPKTEYEEFYKIVEKREKSYEERILRDIQNGIIIETLMAKKHKKTPEEKAAVAKQKKQQRRARRKKETSDNLAKEEILQDDRFFVIAGYTSGGAPYGVTWEEMPPRRPRGRIPGPCRSKTHGNPGRTAPARRHAMRRRTRRRSVDVR